MHTKSVPPSPGAAPLRWQHASAQELKEVKTRFHPDERIRATDTIMVMALALALAFACAPVAFAQPNSSDDADALRAEARRLSAAGATERALAAIRKAVSLRPNDPALHVELAGLLMVAGDNAAARVAVDDALKINPNYANAHQLLAALHRRAGDFESAIREAKLALSLKPDGDYHIGAHVTLGRSYKHLKRYSEAADEFREALRIEQLAFIHKELGDTLFRLEKPDEAVATYRRALELNPYDAHARLNLGAVLEHQGKTEEARKYYTELLQLSPEKNSRIEIEKRLARLQASSTGPASRAEISLLEGDYVAFSDKNYQSQLIGAAGDEREAELVRVLLAHGIRDEEGYAEAAAIRKGLKEIEKLLERAAPQPRSKEILNTLLVAAVERGDVTKARTLLDAGADQKGEALSNAAGRDREHLEMVRFLLERGANPDYVNPNYAQSMEAATPLMYAAGKGHTETVKLLLARGAQVDGRTKGGTALMRAVRSGHAAIVQLLLDKGADVNARDAGETPVLTFAVEVAERVGEWPDERQEINPTRLEILRLLLDKGANVNAQNYDGESPLMGADSAEAVKLLVARGADINARNKRGETAFLRAVGSNGEVAEALLGSGADVNAKDGGGETALINLLSEYLNQTWKPERVLANVQWLLSLARNVDVNAQSEKGETALMRAVRNNNIEVVKLLLSRGADPNAADVLGETAFILAYRKGDTALQKLLSDAAPERPTRAALDAYLVAAIEKKDAAKVKEMLDKGANPNLEYSLGLNLLGTTDRVLVLAAKMGDAPIVQMLLEKGADPNAVGLLGGSESGLEHGTALQAARDPQIIEMLKRAMAQKKK